MSTATLEAEHRELSELFAITQDPRISPDSRAKPADMSLSEIQQKKELAVKNFRRYRDESGKPVDHLSDEEAWAEVTWWIHGFNRFGHNGHDVSRPLAGIAQGLFEMGPFPLIMDIPA